MQQVIYGYGALTGPGYTVTVNHPAVDLTQSYIVLDTFSSSDKKLIAGVKNGGVISDRTSTSFTLTFPPVYQIEYSFHLVYWA